MTQLFRNASSMVLILGLTVPVLAQSKTTRTPEPDLRVNVGIYDYANVASGVLAKAQSEAARVFRRAGIETTWAAGVVPGRAVESDSWVATRSGARR